MQLTFLGTAAAEMYPAIWCECENCSAARRAGGRNIRGNSAALVDGDILLDMNPTCFLVAAQHGISLAGVRHVLVTHAHADHFSPERLKWRRTAADSGYLPFEPESMTWAARYSPLPEMVIHGNPHVFEALKAFDSDLHAENARFDMRFEPLKEGAETFCDGFSFIPVRANHGKAPGFAHSYILFRDGKTLLYALDTGGYGTDALDLILSRRYDCVVAEGTFGLGHNDPADAGRTDRELLAGSGHLNLRKDRALLNLLNRNGCWKDVPRFYLSHLCPHYAPPHDAYGALLEKEGIRLAYDGLRVDL